MTARLGCGSKFNDNAMVKTILISAPILSVGVVRCLLQPDPAGDHLGDRHGGPGPGAPLQVQLRPPPAAQAGEDGLLDGGPHLNQAGLCSNSNLRNVSGFQTTIMFDDFRGTN